MWEQAKIQLTWGAEAPCLESVFKSGLRGQAGCPNQKCGQRWVKTRPSKETEAEAKLVKEVEDTLHQVLEKMDSGIQDVSRHE